jgi:hypothetical protein
MWYDRHTLAEPSAHLERNIEIIWRKHLPLKVAKCQKIGAGL